MNSSMASRVDIDEAFAVGGAAVKAAHEGDSGKMVVIDRVSDDPYQSTVGIYDVHRIANHEKLVPRLDCRPPARCFHEYTTVNPGGLQYKTYLRYKREMPGTSLFFMQSSLYFFFSTRC